MGTFKSKSQKFSKFLYLVSFFIRGIFHKYCCSSKLEEAVCYFVSFVVYSIYKLRDFEMKPVRVSGTVTIEEQQAYIKH